MSNDVALIEDLSNRLDALFDDPEISRLPETLKGLWSRLWALHMTLSDLKDDGSVHAQLEELFRLMSPPRSSAKDSWSPFPPNNLGKESLSNPRSTNRRSLANRDFITSDNSSNKHHSLSSSASESEKSFDLSDIEDEVTKISRGLKSRSRHVRFFLPNEGNDFPKSKSTAPDASPPGPSHSARVASKSNPDTSAHNLHRRPKRTTVNHNSSPRSTNLRSIANQDFITSDNSSNKNHSLSSSASESEKSFDLSDIEDEVNKISRGLKSRSRSLPNEGNDFPKPKSTASDASPPGPSHSARVASKSNPDTSAHNLHRRPKRTTVNHNSSAPPVWKSDKTYGSPLAGPSSSRPRATNDQSSERILPAWQANAIRPRPNVRTSTGSSSAASSAGSHNQPASYRTYFSNPHSFINASAPTSTSTSGSTQPPNAPIDNNSLLQDPQPPEPEVGAMDLDGGDENTRGSSQRTIFVVGQSPSPTSTDFFSKIGDLL